MSLFETAISLVAPTYCIRCGREGPILCSICQAAEVVAYGQHCWRCGTVSSGARTCPKCRHLAGPRFVWVVTHYEGIAAELIRAYKYGHLRAAALSLANIMTATFREYKAAAADDYLVVPVPTATSRLRTRGFDHAGLLARQIAKRLGWPSRPLLGRLGQSRQVGAPRATRLAQPRGHYYLRASQLVAGRNILLIDDVVTTGATLAEVARLLRAHGARRVDALVFAKRL